MAKGRKRHIPVPVWKWVLAYAAMGLGVIGFFAGFDELPDVTAFLGNLFMVFVFLIPSGWWFYCTWKDEREAVKVAELRRSHEQTSQWLGPQDAYYADALADPPEPNFIHRRWPVVVVVTLVCLGMFGVLNSDEDAVGQTTDETTSSSAA